MLLERLLNDRYGVLVAYIVAGVMAILLLLELYNGFLFFFQGTSQENFMKLEGSAGVEYKLTDIPGWHLFGISNATLNSKNFPQTTLDIELLGIFESVPEKYSQAVIAVSGGKGKLYSIGDELPSGAKISRVLDDSVVIERDGKFESLFLPKGQITFDSPPSALNLKKVEDKN